MSSGATLKKLLVKLGLDASQYSKGLDAAAGEANRAGSRITAGLSKIGGAAVLGGLSAVVAGVTAIGTAMYTSIPLASDLAETTSKATVVFEQQSAAMISWSKNAATSFGMSQNSALAAAGTYGNLFRAMGIGTLESSHMSASLVELAADLASFNNMDPTEVLDKLRAGLSGETEPLKTLGVNLNMAEIDMRAVELGLKKVNGQWPASAKAMASYSLIMEQTALAQGDFSRTSEGLANQERINAATVEEARTQLGRLLLPLKTKLVGSMTKKLGPLTTVFGNLGNVVEQAGGNLGALFVDAGQGQTYFDQLFRALGFSRDVSNQLGRVVVWLGQTIMTWVPKALTWIQGVFNAFVNNKGLVVAAIAMIGTAIAVFVFGTVVPAFLAMLAAAAPVILVLALVGGAAYLLYQAWTTNFGGIQEIVANLWAQAQPVFENLVLWLQTNIPLAVQALTDIWNNILWPALQEIWGWMDSVLFPFLGTLAEVIGQTLYLAVEALSGIFQNVILPALKEFWDFIQPWVAFLGEKLAGAFSAVSTAIQDATDWLNDLLETLRNAHLPAWMQPGSPTPWEIGLVGVGKALDKLSHSKLPALQSRLELMPAPAGSYAGGPAPERNIPNLRIDQTINTPIDYELAARRVAQIIKDKRR